MCNIYRYLIGSVSRSWYNIQKTDVFLPGTRPFSSCECEPSVVKVEVGGGARCESRPEGYGGREAPCAEVPRCGPAPGRLPVVSA